MKSVRMVLWGLVLVLGAVVSGVYVGKTFFGEPSVDAASSVGAAFHRARYENAGGPFTLTNYDGETVTEADLEGKPRAMFFGFTHCPDVCPTSMLDAHQWLEALGEDADKLNIVFVSVDPERDTPALLKQYLNAFDERIIGLTADDPDAVRAMADEYGIYYEKVPFANGGYTMNHTADTLLFDENGAYAGYIPYMQPSARQDESFAADTQQKVVAQLRDLVNE
ncbi:SCO family protein [Acuticoccus sp. M5D2P5]|uniref:SCO family protein n=1 Tax=Acuticoccus kalidii TaxID=2910977 RepID=UPI001F26C923|nr:SCO family protein [Acuticoccus kalidii]MCF3934214.1 SCO family protein [Acuticoccus kalidii]